MPEASSTKNAGTVQDFAADWTNEAGAVGAANAPAEDNDTNSAVSSSRTSGSSGAIRFTNFGFEIPTDATVTAIRATVFARSISEATSAATKMFLFDGGVIGDTKTVTDSIGTVYEAASKAEGSGLVEGYWNVTGGLTPAEINGSDFGFNYFFGPVSGGTEQQAIDYVEMEVTYTTPDTSVGPFRRGRDRSRMRGLT